MEGEPITATLDLPTSGLRVRIVFDFLIVALLWERKRSAIHSFL
jgi:hypothetical protein